MPGAGPGSHGPNHIALRGLELRLASCSYHERCLVDQAGARGRGNEVGIRVYLAEASNQFRTSLQMPG